MVNSFRERLFRLWGKEAPALPQYYRRVLNSEGEASSAVLADLASVCLAHEGSYVPGDQAATAFNEGRRSVWLHIQAMREEDSRELSALLDRMNRNNSEGD